MKAQVEIIYQKHSGCNLNLTFWTIDRNHIRGSLLIREANAGIGLGFNIVNEDALLA